MGRLELALGSTAAFHTFYGNDAGLHAKRESQGHGRRGGGTRCCGMAISHRAGVAVGMNIPSAGPITELCSILAKM